MKSKKWEIWWARVKFEESDEIKERPFLIVNGSIIEISIGAPVTSHVPRTECDWEYPVKKWKEAGLSKPSTIRLSKIIKMRDTDLIRKIGMLQVNDILMVQNMLDEMIQSK